MPVNLDFVKGHMGGNTILLLDGRQVPAGRELEATRELLSGLFLFSHEAGLLYPPEGEGHLKALITEPIIGEFISACGGMTQVLGLALAETFLGKRFGLKPAGPESVFLLETVAGLTEIRLVRQGAGKWKVVTDMTAFARECLSQGIRPVTLSGVPAVQAGKFLVLDAGAAAAVYPRADFHCLDEAACAVLVRLQEEFQAATGLGGFDFTLYDWFPARGGHLRALYPHHIPSGHIEPSCGTGSVALALALFESGALSRPPGAGGSTTLLLETGGGPELGGPEMTELTLSFDSGSLARVSFSHSQVEIVATGKIKLKNSP